MSKRLNVLLFCLGVSLLLPSVCIAELELFKESFFSYPDGPLILPPAAPHTTDPTSGPADLGVIILENANIGSRNTTEVTLDAPGVPGKSVWINSETPLGDPEVPSDDAIPVFTGKVAAPTAGSPYADFPGDENFMGFGTYEVTWSIKCNSLDPEGCNQGLLKVHGNLDDIFNLVYNEDTIEYLDVNDAIATTGLDPSNGPNAPIQHFRLLVNITDTPDNNSLELFVDIGTQDSPQWVLPVAQPKFLNNLNTSIDRIEFSIRPEAPSDGIRSEKYFLSDLKIVKLGVDDFDKDRIEDALDNCPDLHNPGQLDRDNDLIGDVCDDCPLTGPCPPPANYIPTGRLASITADGLAEICISWPSNWPGAESGQPIYAFEPTCDNVHFVLRNSSGGILEPNCLTPHAYDIDTTVLIVPSQEYCTPLCDLKEWFPSFTQLGSQRGDISVSDIFYESFITDPWIDARTGNCLDPATGAPIDPGSEPDACRDIWVGRIDILSSPDVNNSPIADDDSYEIEEDGVLTIAAGDGVLSNDTDSDQDALTAVKLSDPLNGNLDLNDDGSFSYTPNENFDGNDSFTYAADDGVTTGNTATVHVTVNPINDTPVAVEDSASTMEDKTLSVAVEEGVLSNDSDVENAPLTADLVSGPSHGVLSLAANGSYTYSPNPDFYGTDSFVYAANDGTTVSQDSTVTITIEAVEDIAADTAKTLEEVPVTIDVLSNDSFEAVPSVTNVTQGANGTISINNDNTVTYSPNIDFIGSDTFSYTVTSGGVDETAVVTVSVLYPWDGFYSPVENEPLVNQVKAGRSIPIKFSLGEDQGLGVFAAGYPKSIAVNISEDGLVKEITDADLDVTATAGNSGLSYNAATNEYIYIWKTSKTWSKSSRQLQIKLVDGTDHTALFRFTK